MSKHPELLTLIEQEFIDYRGIPMSDSQRKHEKKQFINGLMTAARVVGITYDELNVIVEAHPPASLHNEDELSIPAYIRNKK
ncbi:hypothetical protein A6E00_08580 [Vibrio diabolicus]|uniref:Uncharacterized protein n=1 Tax=Vibrio sp. FF_273 TaxID=1652830 RepID=A0A0H3ZWY3_9VIBR|nr:hypothetical protein [Vibrio diabolicus]AKN40873.1 hypothetical protein [Vibrio sp. FF_273]OCH69559.1 hypothetical protein A6E00_08580 [Vibrio diabolicus]